MRDSTSNAVLKRIIRTVCQVMIFWSFGPGAGAALWTQAQLAASSQTQPLLWSEAHIYGGLDSQDEPLHRLDWARLAPFASLPAQAVIGRLARPAAARFTPLELKRPQEIAHRFLYDYDASLSNVIYVVHHGEGWEDRFFDLHFLEDVFVPPTSDRRFRDVRLINDNLFLWSRPAGWQAGVSADEYLFYMIQGEPLFIEVAGRVWVEGASLCFEATVVNHGPRDWVASATVHPGALMCFRCRNNLDFRDLFGERIYYHRLGHGIFNQAASVYSIEGFSNILFQKWTCAELGTPFANALTKYDQASQRGVRFEGAPACSVGGNRSYPLSCIHADVGLAIARETSGRIEAQALFFERAAARGWRGYP